MFFSINAAAVAMVSGKPSQMGVIRMVQIDAQVSAVEGTVDGLSADSKYHLAIHELGDLSSGCQR